MISLDPKTTNANIKKHKVIISKLTDTIIHLYAVHNLKPDIKKVYITFTEPLVL